MLTVTNKDIEYAVQKVVTFALLNKSRTKPEKVDSLNLLAAAVGLDGTKFDHLMDTVKKYYDDEGNIVVGVIIGLFISEHNDL